MQLFCYRLGLTYGEDIHCEIENPKLKSTTSSKRKRDRDGDIISSQQTSTQNRHDKSTDNFLRSISEMEMNLPKENLMEILCDYITSIDGDFALE